jgi:hypothetical protein
LDRIRFAIRPSWNKMTKISSREIPAGTTIYKGTGKAGASKPLQEALKKQESKPQ